ncbi:MAG TPA: DNA-protecting protein DprA [Polyangiaceae bacterium]
MDRVYRVLDSDYPHRLRDLPSPPDPLWIRGELLAAPAVAIVGTRDPTPAAVAHAHALAFRLARRGVTVWSGGAVGIDAAAHRGALEARGLSVAVTGTGLDHCYPAEHAALYDEIVLAGGALVSPFERTQPATYSTFPQRNGVLAALTQATVVIQAPIKSGARSTARFARRLRRPLFVVPAAPWDMESAGNLAELKLGAQLLADDAPLLRLLHLFPVRDVRRPAPAHQPPEIVSPNVGAGPTASLSGPCLDVFRATSSTPRHADDLCLRTGLGAGLVQEALLTLTLQAVLVEGPTGWFRRING